MSVPKLAAVINKPAVSRRFDDALERNEGLVAFLASLTVFPFRLARDFDHLCQFKKSARFDVTHFLPVAHVFALHKFCFGLFGYPS
jgi:hypothetical protein